MAILAQLCAAERQSINTSLLSTHAQEHVYDYYQAVIAEVEADLEHLRRLRDCSVEILTLVDAFEHRLQLGESDDYWPYASYILAGNIETCYMQPDLLSP